MFPTPVTLLVAQALLLLVTGFLAVRSPLVLAVVPSLAMRFVSGDDFCWRTTWHCNAPLRPIVFTAASLGAGEYDPLAYVESITGNAPYRVIFYEDGVYALKLSAPWFNKPPDIGRLIGAPGVFSLAAVTADGFMPAPCNRPEVRPSGRRGREGHRFCRTPRIA